MKKNDIFELEITDMGTDGEGIGHYDGMTFFVKDALIGDVITARATKLKKNYGYARVEEIKTPSTFRVEPECELHKRCGVKCSHPLAQTVHTATATRHSSRWDMTGMAI